ncbi:MAG TPA: hypothetical protein VEQ63_05455 [Bryobacteraceae bacterium]|nr:hypothetical protein [Bryobacteraceae bacterium]
MIASFSVCAVVLLGVYWFRQACSGILRNGTGDYAGQVASTNHLTFVRTSSMLAGKPEEVQLQSLDLAEQALGRDYRIVRYLMANGSRPNHHTAEHWLLALDFQLMRLLYRTAKPFSRSVPKRALLEMCSIVRYQANSVGRVLVRSASA